MSTAPDVGPLEGRARPARHERRLVEAATALLEEAGVDGLTMRALADRLGQSVGATYRHVSGKQALVRLVMQAVVDGVLAVEVQDLPPLARVRAQMLAYQQQMIRFPGLASYVAANLAETAPSGLTAPLVVSLKEAGLHGESNQRALRALFFATSGALLSTPAASAVGPDLLTAWFEDGLDITIAGLRSTFGLGDA